MNCQKCKEELNSLIIVLEESFNVKENPITEYAVPILKTTLDILEAQRLKVENQRQALEGNRKHIEKQRLENKKFKKRATDALLKAKSEFKQECGEAKILYFDLIAQREAARKKLEIELDELKVKYFNETAELIGKIEDYERERIELMREPAPVILRKKRSIRNLIKNIFQ